MILTDEPDLDGDDDHNLDSQEIHNDLQTGPDIDIDPDIEILDGIQNDDDAPDHNEITSDVQVSDEAHEQIDIFGSDSVVYTNHDFGDGDSVLSTEYGIPEDDARYWHFQQHPDTCAIVSQEYILEKFTGQEFDEEDLASEAISNGYYTPGVGTYPDFVGKLLEDHGIEVERSIGNTIDDIKDNLLSGKDIIVGLDANEIWDPSEIQQLKDLILMPEANHAVMVTGFNDSTQEVILNDPGHPQGAGMHVPLRNFENAWDDSDCFMVNTVNTPKTSTV